MTATLFLFLAGSGNGQAQTATVNWTNVHQVIDGFGASNQAAGASMTSTQQQFFFGTGTSVVSPYGIPLGLSLYRAGVTDGNRDPGDCTTVSTSCAGAYVSDMQAIVAQGGRVTGSPWSPPAAYKTNGVTTCTSNAGLATASYANYATWITNFIKSLQSNYSITPFALSIQNEPDGCYSYDSAYWTAAQIDTFIKSNLGPAFASNSISTLIMMPETGNYAKLTGASGGATCGTDSSCTSYVGGYEWHDYDASLSGTNSVTADPYLSGWTSGKRYWETEASCLSPGGPNFCPSSGNPSTITDALDWAAVIDQRLVGDGANAWLYWRFQSPNTTDGQGLMDSSGNVAPRAFMLGQYSKFIRPGYVRIDATHNPASGVSVSAYQNTSTNTLAIVATNYTGSDVSQTFNLTNAPTFSTLTPTTTSASLSLAAQSNVTVSGNSFTYTLPAESITTFVGSSSLPPAPSNLSGTVVQ